MRAALLAGAATRHTRGSPHDREQAVWARLDSEILAPARASRIARPGTTTNDGEGHSRRLTRSPSHAAGHDPVRPNHRTRLLTRCWQAADPASPAYRPRHVRNAPVVRIAT